MSAALINDLTNAARRLGEDTSVRVVVLAANGVSFCAGGDLRWVQEMLAANSADRRAGAIKLAAMLDALNTMPKPLIGRCHGNAFGGGIGLLSVCDVAVAVKDAQFGLTETRLGLVPATIAPYIVARMGEPMARRVFMSSRNFQAQEAVNLGLVAKAVTVADLDAAIEAEIEPYLECAPNAVGTAKALVRALGSPIDAATIEMSAKTLVDQWEGEEAAEGLSAFFEKRKAYWMS